MTAQETRIKFEEFLIKKVDEYFPGNNELNNAIRYSLLAPGKRIRPFLSIAFCEFFKGDIQIALRCGAAIEMIHCYSLIHDDLPSMDNDDYRRGQLSCHKKFGESTAILAGDALLNFAPEFLLKELTAIKCPADRTIELTTLLLKSSGHQGMILGQILDIENEREDANSISSLRQIHALKTGELFQYSCLSGLYSVSSEEIINSKKEFVKDFSSKLGLAFQIIDDILDTTAHFNDLGKTPGKDLVSEKLTYVKFFGLEGAKKEVHQILDQLKKQIPQDLLIQSVITDLRSKLS